VLVFENRGSEVGATISHPHGQIYAYDHVPRRPRTIFERLADGAQLLERAAERTVVEGDGWRAWVPEASGYPYGLRVAPLDPRPDLPALADDERNGAAAILVDVLARLDRLFAQAMPYMLWWNQRPTDGGEWRGAHVHAEIAPILRGPGQPRYVAGAELASGMLINEIAPEQAAAELRAT
jgi:UDPglucose--hexose-1-phosphate uridylyltransferase